MPSIRQIKHRLAISQDKIEAMMARLEQAHLLTTESGYRKGEDGQNTHNSYILSDPIPTLDEFLEVAAAIIRPASRSPKTQDFLHPYLEKTRPEPNSSPLIL